MRVLISNSSLGARGGTQTLVRQMAQGLQALGHSVIAYSSDQRDRERLLENDLLPVSTDLENLPFRPDVIHGQHHLDCMSALNALPGVPAVFYCHGAVWRGNCPPHPRIYRYLAVSRTLRERLIIEFNIPPTKIDVFLNSTDTSRFVPVRNPAAIPRKALFFNGRHDAEGGTVAAIREAASRCGLGLDFMGWAFGTSTDQPEGLLPQYDIVFASGLSAIEALACGCAVVVLGRTGCGEMVVDENFDRLREVNFSIAADAEGATIEGIEAQLRRYRPEGVSRVTARLREAADHRIAARALVGIYEAVIEEHQRTPKDPRAELIATSRYLRSLAPLIEATDNMMGRQWASASRTSSIEELSSRMGAVEKELKRLTRALGSE